MVSSCFVPRVFLFLKAVSYGDKSVGNYDALFAGLAAAL